MAELDNVYELFTPVEFPGSFQSLNLSTDTFNHIINILDTCIAQTKDVKERKDFCDSVKSVRASLLNSSYLYTIEMDDGNRIQQVHVAIWQDDIPFLLTVLSATSDEIKTDYAKDLTDISA